MTGALIGIIIAIIVVAAIIVLGTAQLRRARMRRQFGPEYDRLAKEVGPKKAQAELMERQRRVEALGIHPLAAEQQTGYRFKWAEVQERFVDSPGDAVAAADSLIWSVMRDRGYPADDRNASLEALSVYHAHPLADYRQVEGIRADSASTEQLREAMIRYRALFEDLAGVPAKGRQVSGSRAADDGRPVVAPGDPAADDTSLAAADGEVTADRADRTADSPR